MFIIALKYYIERKLANRRAYLKIRSELAHTNDRALADMGLSRCDAEPISRRAGREAEAAVGAKNQDKRAKAKAFADIGTPTRVHY